MSNNLSLNPALSTSLASALEDIAAEDKRDSRSSPPPSRPPPKLHGRRSKAYSSTENISTRVRTDEGTPLDDAAVEETAAATRAGSGQGEVKKKGRRVRGGAGGEDRPDVLQATRSGWDLSDGAGAVDGLKRDRAATVDDEDSHEAIAPTKSAKEKIKKHTTIGGGGVEEAVTIIIPDLEAVQDNEMLTTVAVAPAVKVNRFKTMQELDGELLASTGQLIEPPTSLAGIDVSLLVSLALNPPDQLVEPDVPWEWDVTFTEVTSDLHPVAKAAVEDQKQF
ncbi:Intraflagellar transport protein 43 [Geranomyces variabilis]|uniref:Intraflagellar transport protein 43 n=1 Tax=Geranomyces variabilis TaxID=109894 RepID=A0AAD5THJ8_9FUNG|nr:Intraflagellar transport protein 43 [Geranomyces variabilis]